MEKKWIIERIDEESLDEEAINGNEPGQQEDVFENLLKKILYKRGITSTRAQKKFLNPQLKNLHDPFKMKGIQQAASLIAEAEKEDKDIIIYGDYDVDGITAAALLMRFFKRYFSVNVDYYLPHRVKEGYGLHSPALEEIINQGTDLLITVDCGISAFEEIKEAQEKGLEVIVTDHHQPPNQLPPAEVILNPHCRADDYPYKFLSGVGVAFKLCEALCQSRSQIQKAKSFLYRQLDLVALGSVADIVSLTGENRILVKKGLEVMAGTDNTGLKILLDKLGLENVLTAGQLGYIVAPPLNAAGRLTDAGQGIELLTTEDQNTAEEIARKLVAINKERQKEEERILEQARTMIENQIDLDQKKGIVLASEDWHAGVIGIVASRIVEEYYRPTILIALNEEKGKGSCRSITSLNIYNALGSCQEELISFGGHAQAAGLNINRSQVSSFRQKFNSYLDAELKKQDLIPQLNIDARLDENKITAELCNKLDFLGPHGAGNPAPKILVNKINPQKAYNVGRDKSHLKIEINNCLEGIGFSMGDYLSRVQKSDVIDLAGKLVLNKWQGTEKAQLRLDDINFPQDSKNFPVYFKTSEYSLADKRGLDDIVKYIDYMGNWNNKIAVYVNEKNQLRQYISRLEEKNFNEKELYTADEECAFSSKKRGILFFSGTELTANVQLDALYFAALPFSLQQFKDIVCQFSFKKTVIHLLYSRDNYYINQKLIKKRLPTAGLIKQILGYINQQAKTQGMKVKLQQIISSKRCNVNQNLINSSLQVGEELGVINREQDTVFCQKKNMGDLDLSRSMRYNNISRIIEDFNEFCHLAFADSLFPLIERLKDS